MTGWVQARPLLSFYLLTFAITWGAWWPMAAFNRGWTDLHLPVLYVLGGLGPGVAAYVIMTIRRGRAAASELLGRCCAGGSAGAGGSWPWPSTR